MTTALVGIIMGSQSDWETMQHAAQMLDQFGIPYESKVVSAHRTPDLLFEYASTAETRGLKVIIAGAGGAAHLPINTRNTAAPWRISAATRPKPYWPIRIPPKSNNPNLPQKRCECG
jgi:phosphoribosylcarboxyaminoimidazole (NCAIR) mutase